MGRLRFWVALFVVVLVIGCDRKEPPKVPPPLPTADSAKAALAEVVIDGRLNSGIAIVHGYIGIIRKSDPAKADALAKDLKELRGLGRDPDAMRAKAKELADKL
jgi:hypothetical protein